MTRTRFQRVGTFALLVGIGALIGVLLKHAVTEHESADSNENVARAGSRAVDHRFTATPTLPQEAMPSARRTMRVPKPQYHARDPLEWQGMRVDLSMQANCEYSKQCGLATACHDGRCGPCKRDDECATGEGCVLDHCLVQSRIGCRSRHDCATDELCVLSGYSADARSNGDMTARCLSSVGGTRQDPEKYVPRENVPAGPTPVRVDDIRRNLEEAHP